MSFAVRVLNRAFGDTHGVLARQNSMWSQKCHFTATLQHPIEYTSSNASCQSSRTRIWCRHDEQWDRRLRLRDILVNHQSGDAWSLARAKSGDERRHRISDKSRRSSVSFSSRELIAAPWVVSKSFIIDDMKSRSFLESHPFSTTDKICHLQKWHPLALVLLEIVVSEGIGIHRLITLVVVLSTHIISHKVDQ